jgi:hypothetical protein
MKRLMLVTAIVLLGGCVVTPAVDHYQSCNALYEDLTDVLACGKKERNTHCMANKSCSASGDELVAFFDFLSYRLKTRQISDPEARWVYTDKVRNIYAELNAERQRAGDALFRAGQDMMNSSGGVSSTPPKTVSPDLCYYDVNGRQKVISRPPGRECPNSYPYRN